MHTNGLTVTANSKKLTQSQENESVTPTNWHGKDKSCRGRWIQHRDDKLESTQDSTPSEDTQLRRGDEAPWKPTKPTPTTEDTDLNPYLTCSDKKTSIEPKAYTTTQTHQDSNNYLTAYRNRETAEGDRAYNISIGRGDGRRRIERTEKNKGNTKEEWQKANGGAASGHPRCSKLGFRQVPLGERETHILLFWFTNSWKDKLTYASKK